MNKNYLTLILGYYDQCWQRLKLDRIPKKRDDDYRKMLFAAADAFFSRGRYSVITEFCLECFDDKRFQKAWKDKKLLKNLSDEERERHAFYTELRDMIYPLFKGMKVDWTAWPWNMDRSENSLTDNEMLNGFILSEDYPYLSAAICYSFDKQIFNDEDTYTPVSRNEVSNSYFYGIKSRWDAAMGKELVELKAGIAKFADVIWEVENHMRVGKLLGFDFLAQSIYDAMDTFIDSTYRANQISFALEMAEWIRANWKIGQRHPAKKRMEELKSKLTELMEKHRVSSPDTDHSWNIIILDILGVSMF